MISKEKVEEMLMCIYTELYANATPPANFKELMDNAPLNSHGQKDIPFNDYEISEEKTNQILNEAYVKYKIKSKWYKQVVKNIILLGCSPKFSENKAVN